MPSHPWHRGLIALALAFVLPAARPAHAVPTVPTGFTVENLTPGDAFDTPTAIAYLPGGRLLVAEKDGVVWSVTNGVRNLVPLVAIQNEVLNYRDKGLLGLAVDPDYVSNHYIYLLYTVDPDSDAVETNDVAFGRLTRYTVSFADSNTVNPSSRAILMGVDWAHGAPTGSPTHTVACLRWGADKSLLVSVGDGALFLTTDPGGLYPSLFDPGRADPYQDIGAFRAQSISSLDGKVLRIDPHTGHGYPSNPFYNGDVNAVRSKVWAYGFRNPFRFTVKPGTGSADPATGNPGTLYLGDVGWNTYEELDVVKTAGFNGGWPCYEAFASNDPYQTATPAHNGCGSFGSADNPSQASDPILSVHHFTASLSVPPGYIGYAVSGTAFYTGTGYPVTYRGKCFFEDYGQDWIKMAETDANDQLIDVVPFASGMDAPVDLTVEPVTGDLVYVSIATGEIRRIHYVGGGGPHPPVAEAAGAPMVGTAPLLVHFTAGSSYDPDGDPITLSWMFGDGAAATGVNPSHSYGAIGVYDAVLTVEDTTGFISRDTVEVVVRPPGSFPTTPVRDDFNRADGPVGNGWTGDVAGLAIASNQLTLTDATASAVFPTVFPGAVQEAYLTFDTVTPGGAEENLMMNCQGDNWFDGHIEINYQPVNNVVMINTYTPAGLGWEVRGGPIPVTFGPGDQLGARVYQNGGVEVFKNGVVVGDASVAGWAFAGKGGRIGLTVTGAVTSHWDNFGGGDWTPGTLSVGDTPRPLALSAAWPNPAAGRARLSLDLPSRSHVDFAVYDITGRQVWSEAPRDYGLGRWTLTWPGTRSDGGRAPAGVYLARVRVNGAALVRRFVLIR